MQVFDDHNIIVGCLSRQHSLSLIADIRVLIKYEWVYCKSLLIHFLVIAISVATQVALYLRIEELGLGEGRGGEGRGGEGRGGEGRGGEGRGGEGRGGEGRGGEGRGGEGRGGEGRGGEGRGGEGYATSASCTSHIHQCITHISCKSHMSICFLTFSMALAPSWAIIRNYVTTRALIRKAYLQEHGKYEEDESLNSHVDEIGANPGTREL